MALCSFFSKRLGSFWSSGSVISPFLDTAVWARYAAGWHGRTGFSLAAFGVGVVVILES